MDSFDIFKKLTLGAKFKRKNSFPQNLKVRALSIINVICLLYLLQPKKAKFEDKFPEIKEEPIDECYAPYESLNNSCSDIDIKSEDEDVECEKKKEDRVDGELTLLGSITASESGKKKKNKKEKVFDDKKNKMLEQEKMNHFRNVNNINVVGRNVPHLITDFRELKISADLIENLAKCGYESPTPIQKQAVPIMLQVNWSIKNSFI